MYLIATYGESCELRIILFWSVANNNAAVGDIFPAVGGDICLINEEIVLVPLTWPDIPWVIRPNYFP